MEPGTIFYVNEPTNRPNHLPTVCLNMIVKNESKIIARLLESVAPYIDSYCICDTGSTDNTVEVIRAFFKTRSIPGIIVNEPFRDFGHNRSFALKACLSQEIAAVSDYILLLDADMVFKVNPVITPQAFRKGLTQDAYYVLQGSEQFYYKNVRIVKKKESLSYWGVTHEYIKTPEGTTYGQFEKGDVFIEDIGDGGCKADKFDRDVQLLKRGLEDEPGNDRYTFYLANSYRDSGNQEAAIETYKKRVELGGWHEEVWYSYYSIGKCYKALGNMTEAIHWWMEAYDFFPERIENLYEIVTHYRCIGKNRLAYPFYALAKDQLLQKRKMDYLFLQKDIYDYKLEYELTIIGYYENRDKYDLARVCMEVLTYPHLEEWTSKNIMSNYKFYTKAIRDLQTVEQNDHMAANYALLADIGKTLVNLNEFLPSTPTMTFNQSGELVVNVRFVNYKIDDQGGYVNGDTIETINVLATFNIFIADRWTKTSEMILQHDRSLDNVYVGLEDVRLFTMDQDANDVLYYNANRGLDRNQIAIETGKIDPISGKTVDSQMLQLEGGQGPIEKNWVYFQDARNHQKMIYGWHPLTIGSIESTGTAGTFKKTHSIETPAFFKHVRGSTNGVLVGEDEVWFLCHTVSYEDRRYYYHQFVVLDRTTYQIKRYTPFFTFEKEKVEYSLGFVYFEARDEFLIGYSTMDRCTKYMTVSKTCVDAMFL